MVKKDVVLKPGTLDKEAIGRSIGVLPNQVALKRYLSDVLDAAELPAPWTEQVDEKKRLFYWNPASRTSSWTHPLDPSFRSLVAAFKEGWPTYTPGANLEAIVQDELKRSQEELEAEGANWRWAKSADGVTYYYNEATRDTRWDDPREELMHHLRFRYRLLELLLQPDYVVMLKELEGWRPETARQALPAPEPAPAPEPVASISPMKVVKPKAAEAVVEDKKQIIEPVVEVAKLVEPEGGWPVEFWMNTREYGLYLGIDEKTERVILELLRPVFMMPLPSPWRAKMDQKQRIYFYHSGLSTSSWKHPHEEYLRYVLDFLRRHRPYFREPVEIARVLVDEIEDGFVIDEAKSNILKRCKSLRPGFWSGPWHDPDYGLLFYTQAQNDQICRWDDVPASVTEELKYRNDGWRLLWRSFLGDAEPYPISTDEIDSRCLQVVRGVLGDLSKIPSLRERELFPMVKNYLNELYGQANFAVSKTEMEKHTAELEHARGVEKRAMERQKTQEAEKAQLKAQMEKQKTQHDEERAAERAEAEKAIREAQEAAAAASARIVEVEKPPKAVIKAVEAFTSLIKEKAPEPEPVVEEPEDELELMSDAPSAPPSDLGSPVVSPRQTTDEDMRRSGLLFPKPHEIVPDAPLVDPAGRDWDYVEWCKPASLARSFSSWSRLCSTT
jgi:hypothetical protein